MYLKTIVASGFKSFADKITIDLTSGVTGIVGPNGSGKSNVVDAIRWVLGEQSVKSLRGEGNMTDVIFSGSKSRKPLNVASVTLIFDNSDKYLNVDYDEVAIKRRVYKDGTNEYLINNEKCRLKDITDLFLDTGVAKESFNIISQGKVEEIINSKPNERRIIFEEAAGVLKYKKRKEDALRKLDKTHDNMSRVNDIISELEVQVNPLKEQKELALKYNELNKELESIEVALITKEITDINYEYQVNKEKIETLNNEIISISTTNSTNEAKIEEYKTNINKLNNVISELQARLVEETTNVERINSRKNILLERQKYEVENTKLHNNLVELKNEELKLTTEISSIEDELKFKEEELKNISVDYQKYEEYLNKAKETKTTYETELSSKLIIKNDLEHKIAYLKESIENNSTLPYSVKSILNNPKLSGIHNVIGNLIEVEEKYALAITTSLGFAISNLVVDNENNAKEAIKYLSDNNIGRVTFFPLNIIKGKSVSDIDEVRKIDGFIDIASNLVKYDKKYDEIIKNQLGNVIVVNNIDTANKVSKVINHKYKIVTLDGNLIHIGGSLTGGVSNKNKNIITEKYELENLIKDLDKLVLDIKEIENNINDSDYAYKTVEDKLYLINKEKIGIEEFINNKNSFIKDKQIRLLEVQNEIIGTNNIMENNISKEEEEVLNEYYNAVEEKNKTENELNSSLAKLNNLKDDLDEFEFSVKKENSNFNQKNKELKDLEISVNRMDVKLDTLLTKLNETYSMTYEKAVTLYELDIDIDLARNRVNNLKRQIKDLGNVNLGAIEEYDRVSVRYDFLIKQREDLAKAEDTLLEIIEEMDSVMETEFSKAFNLINTKFTETFKELFKGGHAELKLTNPDDILETGIEIIASPPGKSLKSISLLSGGEKTFTAISLLFAILKARPVPFCVLDEVEAALDEVNVDGFGEYLMKLKEKTQFILITHKKRTMEYVDVLYGITMQESGVSKLVSVKLETL